MLNTSPAFNLKVVLKETGIAADTLRAWERRYGLPMPQRTEGGLWIVRARDVVGHRGLGQAARVARVGAVHGEAERGQALAACGLDRDPARGRQCHHARNRPPMVRQPGDDGVVGRSLAE